jgi:methionyl-tRNA formyltransferase
VPLAPAPSHPQRFVFLGTPAFAVPALRALVDAGRDVALVVSQPDKRRGRGGALVPSPVKAAALELGLPVTDRVDDVLGAGADLGVVAAFGRIIKPQVLAELPMVNLHFSLLPRWRGAAPVERAILAGDERTGVDLMVVEAGLDTGGVYDRVVVDIGPDETADELVGRLSVAGAELLERNLARGRGQAAPQAGEPTYAHKVDPAERQIDWTRPAVDVHRLVRIGGAWTTHDGARLKVWRTALPPAGGPGAGAGTVTAGEAGASGGSGEAGVSGGTGAVGQGVPVEAGDGPVLLVEVQPEGKRRMAAADWARGARWHASDKLGT